MLVNLVWGGSPAITKTLKSIKVPKRFFVVNSPKGKIFYNRNWSNVSFRTTTTISPYDLFDVFSAFIDSPELKGNLVGDFKLKIGFIPILDQSATQTLFSHFGFTIFFSRAKHGEYQVLNISSYFSDMQLHEFFQKLYVICSYLIANPFYKLSKEFIAYYTKQFSTWLTPSDRYFYLICMRLLGREAIELLRVQSLVGQNLLTAPKSKEAPASSGDRKAVFTNIHAKYLTVARPQIFTNTINPSDFEQSSSEYMYTFREGGQVGFLVYSKNAAYMKSIFGSNCHLAFIFNKRLKVTFTQKEMRHYTKALSKIVEQDLIIFEIEIVDSKYLYSKPLEDYISQVGSAIDTGISVNADVPNSLWESYNKLEVLRERQSRVKILDIISMGYFQDDGAIAWQYIDDPFAKIDFMRRYNSPMFFVPTFYYVDFKNSTQVEKIKNIFNMNVLSKYTGIYLFSLNDKSIMYEVQYKMFKTLGNKNTIQFELPDKTTMIQQIEEKTKYE